MSQMEELNQAQTSDLHKKYLHIIPWQRWLVIDIIFETEDCNLSIFVISIRWADVYELRGQRYTGTDFAADENYLGSLYFSVID